MGSNLLAAGKAPYHEIRKKLPKRLKGELPIWESHDQPGKVYCALQGVYNTLKQEVRSKRIAKGTLTRATNITDLAPLYLAMAKCKQAAIRNIPKAMVSRIVSDPQKEMRKCYWNYLVCLSNHPENLARPVWTAPEAAALAQSAQSSPIGPVHCVIQMLLQASTSEETNRLLDSIQLKKS